MQLLPKTALSASASWPPSPPLCATNRSLQLLSHVRVESISPSTARHAHSAPPPWRSCGKQLELPQFFSNCFPANNFRPSAEISICRCITSTAFRVSAPVQRWLSPRSFLNLFSFCVIFTAVKLATLTCTMTVNGGFWPNMRAVPVGDYIQPTRKTNGVGVQADDTRICVVMVGLPARGKSLIAQKGNAPSSSSTEITMLTPARVCSRPLPALALHQSKDLQRRPVPSYRHA